MATVCFKVMLIFYVSDYEGVGGLSKPGVAGVGESECPPPSRHNSIKNLPK